MVLSNYPSNKQCKQGKNSNDSTSSRRHVWLYPDNQQHRYEEMTQGQLPSGWNSLKVDTKRKAFKTVHELSYLNKTINNEVNKTADRCLHCGTTLHWHLKIILCHRGFNNFDMFNFDSRSFFHTGGTELFLDANVGLFHNANICWQFYSLHCLLFC